MAPDATPIYFFIKDIQKKCEQENKSLREVAKNFYNQLDDKTCESLMKLSLNDQKIGDADFLNKFFEMVKKTNYWTYKFCLMSCITFADSTGSDCYPAEIGLTNFSMEYGIESTNHVFIHNENEINLPGAIKKMKEYHYIPVDRPMEELVTIPKLLQYIHKAIHTSSSSYAIVLIDDSEFDETFKVLDWFETKSTKENLNLNWEAITCVRISEFWKYLNEQFSYWPHQEPLAVEAVRDYEEINYSIDFTKFDMSDVCRYHKLVQTKNCAKLRANIYTYNLLDYGCTIFSHPKLTNRHRPAVKYYRKC